MAAAVLAGSPPKIIQHSYTFVINIFIHRANSNLTNETEVYRIKNLLPLTTARIGFTSVLREMSVAPMSTVQFSPPSRILRFVRLRDLHK